MKYSNVCIESVAGEIPKNVVSSQSIEDTLKPLYEKLQIPVGSLEKLTGIRERRFWDSGTLPSQGSVWAGEKALQEAQIQPKDIECIFHCAVSRDCLEPATANFVHHKLGLPEKSMVFDISNSHLGFMNGVMTAANMIELGQAKAALVVSSEDSREVVEEGMERLLEDPDLDVEEFQSSFPTLTRGDGAVAMVLTHKDISRTGHQLIGGMVRFEGGSSPLQPTWELNESAQNPNGFIKKKIILVKDVWQHFMSLVNWTPEVVNKAFYHLIDPKNSLVQTLNLKKNQAISVTEYFGNLVSIGVPMALVNGLEKKILSKGDCFTMLGLSSDFDCFMLGGVWNN